MASSSASPLETAFGVVGVLAGRRSLCGAINGLIVIYGRLQPIVTTIATGAIYFGIALLLRPRSRRRGQRRTLADALTGQLFGGVPASLVAAARRSCSSSGCRSAAR